MNCNNNTIKFVIEVEIIYRKQINIIRIKNDLNI